MIFVGLSAAAAQISVLCIQDFDGGAQRVPFSFDGERITFILLHSFL